MAGRPKIFNEEEVIHKAINIFWSNGYEATSTENLLSEMEINRGSLYHCFGSKKELFAKSLDLFAINSIKMIEQKIGTYDNPIVGIKNFFIELSSADYDTHNKGCFMGNSLSELSNLDDELKSKATKNLVVLENVFFKYISKAKEDGQLLTTEDNRILARYLLNLWNGINITRRMYPNKEVLESIIKLQLSILN
jgi:TetR/AcrR family transcriptional repressor of nem operon